MLIYVLITPARNEANLIEGTIQSVIAQSVLPLRWVIASDGSTDGTDDVVRNYSTKYPWIELLRMPERQDRQFAAKALAFNAGYEHLRNASFDLIGNLDADITFDTDYYRFLLGEFAQRSRLGVAGTPFVEDHQHPGVHTYDHAFANLDHVSGAVQFFRRECFEQIGGYVPIKGGAIDWIAVTTARMNGWETRTFTEKVCFHHRKLGTGTGRNGALRMKFHYGRKAYYVGGHPLWEIPRGVFAMRKQPLLFGGLFFIAGYISGAIQRIERPVSRELIEFHRREQMQRLRRNLGLSPKLSRVS